jgi:DNA-binding MurR/RpiR family transcriptional regulator
MPDPTPDAPDDRPRDFKALRDLLVAGETKLPKRLQQVAAFAIRSPDEIAFGTVASIAESAGVQPSTLVRFAQALGYTGFSELQGVFRERLRDRPSSYDARLAALRDLAGERSTAGALLDGFANAAIHSIDLLRERVAVSTLDTAAARLAGAETIYLLGQRRSFPAAAYLGYAFGQLDIKTVQVGSMAGTDIEILKFASPRDAAIAISYSPYAPATLGHARQLASQSVPIVAITDSPFSPLVSLSELWFEVVEADYDGFRSLAATFALAMTLSVAVADQRRAQKK